VNAGLASTGPVADDLYLMAHHETSGRLFLQSGPLGIGLAGALLAELMLDGHVFVGDDGAVPDPGGRAVPWRPAVGAGGPGLGVRAAAAGCSSSLISTSRRPGAASSRPSAFSPRTCSSWTAPSRQPSPGPCWPTGTEGP